VAAPRKPTAPPARVRGDLTGVVYVGGHILAAGDPIPEAVAELGLVGDHLTEQASPAGEDT
jgi:hypothetical protein